MALYRKSLTITHSEAKSSAAVSLMSTDIDGIIEGVVGVHDIWVGLLEACVGVYLLAQYAGAAAVIVVGSIMCKRSSRSFKIFNCANVHHPPSFHGGVRNIWKADYARTNRLERKDTITRGENLGCPGSNQEPENDWIGFCHVPGHSRAPCPRACAFQEVSILPKVVNNAE